MLRFAQDDRNFFSAECLKNIARENRCFYLARHSERGISLAPTHRSNDKIERKRDALLEARDFGAAPGPRTPTETG
jgi:hypothetical protein